jgi:hypothetical protein
MMPENTDHPQFQSTPMSAPSITQNVLGEGGLEKHAYHSLRDLNTEVFNLCALNFEI